MGLKKCEAIRRHVPADVSRDERRYEGGGPVGTPFFFAFHLRHLLNL